MEGDGEAVYFVLYILQQMEQVSALFYTCLLYTSFCQSEYADAVDDTEISCFCFTALFAGNFVYTYLISVSYTHLDVYKRQVHI